jgi:hypothetical protein
MPVDYLNDPLTVTGASPPAPPVTPPTLSDDAAAQIAKANMQHNMQQSQSHIGDVQGYLNQPELDKNNQFVQEQAEIGQRIVKAGPSLEDANNAYYNAWNTHLQSVNKLNEAMRQTHPGQAASAFALSFLGLGSPYVQLMKMKNLGPAAAQEQSTKAAMDNYANLLAGLDKNQQRAIDNTMKSSAGIHQSLATKMQIEGQIGTAINQASEIASRVMGIPHQNQEIEASKAAQANSIAQANLAKFNVEHNKPGMDIEKEKLQIAGEGIRNKNEANAEASKQQAQNRSSHLGYLQDEAKSTRADWKEAQKAQAAAEKKLAEIEEAAKEDPKGYEADLAKARQAAKDAATNANRTHSAYNEAHKNYNDFATPLVGHSNAQSQSSPQAEMDQLKAKFRASTDENEKAQLSKRYQELYAVAHKGQ